MLLVSVRVSGNTFFRVISICVTENKLDALAIQLPVSEGKEQRLKVAGSGFTLWRKALLVSDVE